MFSFFKLNKDNILYKLIKKIIKKLFFIKNNNHQPDWKPYLKRDKSFWKETLKNVDKDDKILIATSVGRLNQCSIIESILGIALTLRKKEIHILLCDDVLPVCMDCTFDRFKNLNLLMNGKNHLCRDCFKNTNKMLKSLGFKVIRYSDLIGKKELKEYKELSNEITIKEIKNYNYNGISIGEHALAGALRFFSSGTLENEQYGENILRKYFNAGLITSRCMQNLFSDSNYESAVFHHGIYIPQGIIGEYARKYDIHVVNWSPAYRNKTFIFSHNDTYHHTLMTEPVDKWNYLKLTKKLDEEITNYLKSRWYGTNDWIWFHENPDFNINKIIKELKIDVNKPCIGLLTNVIWDAQLHYPTNIFSNMIEWLIETIKYFIANRNDLQLIIRIHPAEIRGTVPSRHRINDEIKKRFPELPPNIIVIQPESSISTYPVMELCKTVIIYGTKAGVELTSKGIPVIVAGEAWIKNKGITIDPKTKDEYFNILSRLPLENMNEEDIIKAKLYAYHFFFRRMIPLDFMDKEKKEKMMYSFKINSLIDFSIGNYKGLDVICDGIINKSDFIYKAELDDI